jgi:hypothetical protein
VFLDYPTASSLFHGELAVSSGGTAQTVVVPIINEYVSQCVMTYLTQVNVHDGHQTDTQAPLLLSLPVTLTSVCP